LDKNVRAPVARANNVGKIWAVGLESKIPKKADVRYVGGDWKASPFGGEKFHHGLKPEDFAIKKQ